MPAWQSPPSNPCLNNSAHIHLWLTELVRPPERLAQLRQLLSNDERARADRFHFERDRDSYTIGRGVLREVIAQYLSLDSGLEVGPTEIEFSYNKYGRPTLSRLPSSVTHLLPSFNFNVSHSGQMVLYGFALDRAIGVDIECHRDTINFLEIAKGFFSPTENQTLNSLSTAEEHMHAFYNCWTRKEAYIKAHGMGLSMPLDSFDVTLAPGAAACLEATRPDAAEVQKWMIEDVPIPAEGYTAAIALELSRQAEGLTSATPIYNQEGNNESRHQQGIRLSTFRF